MIINKGFKPKREKDKRLPPGQYETKDFPVLSLGPTPQISKSDWSLKIFGLVEHEIELDWEKINTFPQKNVVKDIHCVTKWSKFDTNWKGVDLEDIISIVKVKKEATHIIAYSYDGYTTNLPMEDILNGKAMVALEYDGQDIEAKHGGPARLLVPHLYFWKSAKWLKGIEFVDADQPGFWEKRGYHNYGNPWKEQRYTNDE